VSSWVGSVWLWIIQSTAWPPDRLIWREGNDKGAGLTWLAQETGVPLAQMAGVGDAEGDLCFLQMCGFCAAPANAEPGVHAGVDYVSPYDHSRGLLDIIERVMRDVHEIP